MESRSRCLASTLRFGLALAGLCLAGFVGAQEPGATSGPQDDPFDIGKQEQVDVRLVLIDVVVLDRQNRTVPDLTLDDFEIVVDGATSPIDTLDLSCEEGAVDDVLAVSHPKRRKQLEQGSGQQIVLVLDYLHLSHTQRTEVLEEAKQIVRYTAAPDDSIMVAALNGGLRIEQAFTTDHERAIEALHRMEYDISLWQPSYQHVNELPFFNGMNVLLRVLESVQGSKAMVLYSNNRYGGVRDDLQFARLAAAAAASRCSIYPSYALGLQPP